MQGLQQSEGISPAGTFPSPVKRDRGRGIETFGAPPLALPWIGPLQNDFFAARPKSDRSEMTFATYFVLGRVSPGDEDEMTAI
jgi:hypothetical protein